MDTKDIKKAIAYSGHSVNALADTIGVTAQTLGQGINRGSLKQDSLKKLCEAMGAVYREYIEFPDGTKIGIK